MKISTISNKAALSQSRIATCMRKVLVALFWLILWQILYLVVKQEILIVSPVRASQRLFELAGEGEFWLTAMYSMLRIVSGFLLGVGIGTLLAALTSMSRFLYDLFHPIVSIIKATPVASFILLALVWIESPYVPVFTSFLMVLPVVWGNVSNGIAKTDRNLLQMAAVYRFHTMKTIRRIYLPSVMPYFTAACTTGMGLSWKAGVAAEVLANTKHSIGGNIYNAKIYIETADLFAWTAVVIVISVVLEKLMVKLMKAVGKKYNLS